MMGQAILVAPFNSSTRLVDLLSLVPPPFARSGSFRQLKYIEDYVGTLNARSLILEGHYIDRDFIEDHSLFYSRSLYPYENSCRRLHFFDLEPPALESELAALERLCSEPELARAARWRKFSEDHYLGFVVIKPLQGSPVGRTVLKSYGPDPDDKSGDRREFPGARRYPVHLGAVELEITGLAFQQQDVGVSACATTALWSSLHNLRRHEEIGSPTPAQITTLATRYSLPFGRAIPSEEGLSLDQMCQALQELGVAPSLFHVNNFRNGRAVLFGALRSGLAPILVIQSETDDRTWHATAVAGYRHAAPQDPGPGEIYDRGADLLALYVHDDRIGPYQRVDLVEANDQILLVRKREPKETWRLRYILVPLHTKVRLSISHLWDVALRATTDVKNLFTGGHGLAPQQGASIAYEAYLCRAHSYLQELLAGSSRENDLARLLSRTVVLPRYVGVVALSGASWGRVDLLLDTTSTRKNLHVLGVASRQMEADALAAELGARYGCPVWSA